jgi:hypothetical protein
VESVHDDRPFALTVDCSNGSADEPPIGSASVCGIQTCRLRGSGTDFTHSGRFVNLHLPVPENSLTTKDSVIKSETSPPARQLKRDADGRLAGNRRTDGKAERSMQVLRKCAGAAQNLTPDISVLPGVQYPI